MEHRNLAAIFKNKFAKLAKKYSKILCLEIRFKGPKWTCVVLIMTGLFVSMGKNSTKIMIKSTKVYIMKKHQQFADKNNIFGRSSLIFLEI